MFFKIFIFVKVISISNLSWYKYAFCKASLPNNLFKIKSAQWRIILWTRWTKSQNPHQLRRSKFVIFEINFFTKIRFFWKTEI